MGQKSVGVIQLGITIGLMTISSPTRAEENKLVSDIKAKAVSECKEIFPEQKAEAGEGFVTEANFSIDGKKDFVFNYGAISCGPLLHCGSAGCFVSVFVSTKKGYVEAIAENFQLWSIKKSGDKDVLELGSKEGPRSMVWNGKKFVRN